MKQNIIVTTDFSGNARNSLQYACSFAQHQGSISITLLYIHKVPMDFTPEGVVLASMQNMYTLAEQKLLEEYMWAAENFPGIDIQHRATIGGFIESLNGQIAAVQATMVIVPAGENLESSWFSRADIAEAIPVADVPIMLVPPGVLYQTYRNVAFACDYRKACIPRQIQQLKELSAADAGVQLHVIHVTRGDKESQQIKEQNLLKLQESISELSPKYYNIESEHVVAAINNFVAEHQIDLLVVIPRKHDFWFKIFNSTHTNQLAKLGRIPVLALHDE